MPIVIEDPQMENLVRQMALAKGVTIGELLRESLMSMARLRGPIAEKASLRERLAALAQEVDALPPRMPADTRSEDEILGYDEQGIW